MTAHVAYPALDPAGVSATGSAAMLRRLLRDELGFGGVVVSDSLLMGGAGADGDTVSRTVPDLVRAGVDVLLDVSDPRAAVDALVRAVTNGDLDERLLDEAFQRVWSMKTRVAGRGASPSDGREARELADTVASLAVQVDAGSPAALAALLEAPDVPIAVIRPHTTYPDPTRSDAESVLSAMLPWARVHAVGPDTTEQQRAAVAEAAAAAGGCVAVLVVKPAAWHRFGLRPEQDRLVAALTQAVPTLVCVLGSPDVVDRYGQAAGRVRVYSDVEASVRALAARLAELRRSPVV